MQYLKSYNSFVNESKKDSNKKQKKELKYTPGLPPSKQSKRKIGDHQVWCMNLGYKGSKNGKCYGKNTIKDFKHMDYDKDYYWDKD